MRTLWILLFPLCLHASTRCPHELTRLYPHGWHHYIDKITSDARELSLRVMDEGRHFQLSDHYLTQFFEFALENAAGHGSRGSGSRVSIVNRETDGWIVVTIRNRRHFPVPTKLLATFTPSSPPVRIEEHERDRAGGVQGKGVRRLFEVLPKLVRDAEPVSGEPSMRWSEVEVAGETFVEFEVWLPFSTRVLRPRTRRQ